jgi:hypothetical protein
MRTYIKPNVLLPVSMHDAHVTNVTVSVSPSNAIDGGLVFEFADGYSIVDEKVSRQTKHSSITFSGIDFDFSHVYYCKDDSRKTIDFPQFAKDVQKFGFEIIDEAYGYNQTRFSGSMFLEKDWFEVEIEIYHFNETKYEWME